MTEKTFIDWFWPLHIGFRQQAWTNYANDYSTELEPDLDWWTDNEAETAGYSRRFN